MEVGGREREWERERERREEAERRRRGVVGREEGREVDDALGSLSILTWAFRSVGSEGLER